MTLTLRELIRASGGAASAGQSGRVHVTGAASGATGRQYLLQHTGTPALSGVLLSPDLYAAGSVINAVITWPNYGSRFFNIRRNGVTPWTNAGTLVSLVINSATWDEGAGTVTLNCTLQGEYDELTLPALTDFRAWFQGYSSPSRPADGDPAGYDVEAFPTSVTPGSPTGHDDLYLAFSYDPDTDTFNPGYFGPTNTVLVRVARRAYPSWTTMYEWEFHSDNTYTNVISSLFFSYENSTYSWYARYRKKAAYNGGSPGGWVNYGLVSWVDPRPDV